MAVEVDQKFIDEYNRMSSVEFKNRYENDPEFKHKVDVSGAVDVELSEFAEGVTQPSDIAKDKETAEVARAVIPQEVQKSDVSEAEVRPEIARVPEVTAEESKPAPATIIPSAASEPEEDEVFEKTSKGWQVVIDLKDGSGQQVFKGKTKAEVTKKLVDAQANATRKIRQQQLQIKLGSGTVEWEHLTNPPDFSVRPLAAEETYQLTQDLSDPAKMAATFKRLQEADAEYQTMRRESWEAKQFEQARTISDNWVSRNVSAFKAFRDANNIHAVENRSILKQYFEKNNLAVTEKNLELAFLDLMESGLLLQSPEPEEPKQKVAVQELDIPVSKPASAAPAPLVQPKPQPVAPIAPAAVVVERPRSAPSSTGASARGSSAVAPPTAPTRPRLTVEEYNRMPAREVRRRILARDKDFIEDVELLTQTGKI